VKYLNSILVATCLFIFVVCCAACDADTENGYGTFTWPNGNKYVGEWKNGDQNGYGTFTWPSGAKYEGEWKDSDQNGYGTFTWPSGEKYEGEWKDSNMHGHGTYTWQSGEKAEGEWIDGKVTWSSENNKKKANTGGNTNYSQSGTEHNTRLLPKPPRNEPKKRKKNPEWKQLKREYKKAKRDYKKANRRWNDYKIGTYKSEWRESTWDDYARETDDLEAIVRDLRQELDDTEEYLEEE
jgi:hypothetical protein